MAHNADETKGIVLVTGASSGIGEATTEALVADGWRCIAAARRTDRLDELTARLGPACHPLALDVNDPAATQSLVERLPDELCAIDVLINNAGIDLGGRARFDHGSVEDWAATVETNITGVMRVTRAIVPGMLERGRGHIVNIGSSSGVTTFADDTAYIASKWGLRGLSGALRADYLDKGIRVSEVQPGMTRSNFAATRWRGDSERADALYATYPELLTVQDVAACVVFTVNQPPNANIAELLIVPSA
jgi:3-hydroxy acid dehydrogenase/malonic semialdehyde reductase